MITIPRVQLTKKLRYNHKIASINLFDLAKGCRPDLCLKGNFVRRGLVK